MDPNAGGRAVPKELVAAWRAVIEAFGNSGDAAHEELARALRASIELQAEILGALAAKGCGSGEQGRPARPPRTLQGLLPICASCKKIRNSAGYWEGLEDYIEAHSEAAFSHGVCPECEKRLYPELDL